MEGQRQKRRFWCTSFPWLQGQLLSSKPSGVKQVPSCAPALINDEECSFVKKAPEAGSVLSGKEMKWLVDNVWHRGENGGNGNILDRFFQNLFKLILSGKCSKEPGKAKPGFPVMSKPQITGASEPLAPQSSQAWQGRAGSGTCVYKPPELFSIISFCFLTTWICLSIIIVFIESVTLRTKWATGSSGYKPTGGSREEPVRLGQQPQENYSAPWKVSPVASHWWTKWCGPKAQQGRQEGAFLGVQVEKSLRWK